MSYFVLCIVQVSNYTLPDDVTEVTYDVILYVTIDHVMCYCEQVPVIDIGQDYSKDRINDYTVERDDWYSYIVGCMMDLEQCLFQSCWG